MKLSEKSSRNLNFFLRLATSLSSSLALAEKPEEKTAGSVVAPKPALVPEDSSEWAPLAPETLAARSSPPIASGRPTKKSIRNLTVKRKFLIYF